MEGPHGSGGATPETTVSWLWGFGFGAFTLSVLWVSHSYFESLPIAGGIAAVALLLTGVAALFITDFFDWRTHH